MSKKNYTIPSLNTFGNVEELTENSAAINFTDVPFGTPVDPADGLGPITS